MANGAAINYIPRLRWCRAPCQCQQGGWNRAGYLSSNRQRITHSLNYNYKKKRNSGVSIVRWTSRVRNPPHHSLTGKVMCPHKNHHGLKTSHQAVAQPPAEYSVLFFVCPQFVRPQCFFCPQFFGRHARTGGGGKEARTKEARGSNEGRVKRARENEASGIRAKHGDGVT